jgi:Ca2+:H+ antiporter
MIRKMRINRYILSLVIFIPLCVVLALFHANTTFVFLTAIVALIPIAAILGYTTKQVALQTNPTIGGLLSATFGNIIELFIAVLALREGLVRLVQASLIGSIIGNVLLLIGLSIFFGGLKYKHQRFNSRTAGVSSTMLIIAVVGLTIPSLYAFVTQQTVHIDLLSDIVSIVLALTYVAGLFFSMFTHRDMFDAADEIRATRERPTMTKREAAFALFGATVLAALMSELLVQSIHGPIATFGMSETFIGLVVIAIVTNIAEKSMAISFAMENKLNLAMEIGMSSAIQIALFVVPILVAISQIFHFGFTLVFSLFELVAVMLTVMIINDLAADGRCNWLEGVQLISVYCIIAAAFVFV